VYAKQISGKKYQTEQNKKESQLAGGKPVGDAQAWPRSRTWGYEETTPASGQSGI